MYIYIYAYAYFAYIYYMVHIFLPIYVFFLVCISKHEYIKSFSGFMMKVCKVHMSEFSTPVDESMNLDQPLQQEMGGCAQLLQAAGNDSPDDSESYVFVRFQTVTTCFVVTSCDKSPLTPSLSGMILTIGTYPSFFKPNV